jgi:hypothetical protein
LIELRRFRTDEIDLVQLIQNELTTCGLPESAKLVKALLEEGRLLILLDGVDEVPGDRLDKAITHMRDFIDRHSNNRFVISCRTAFYKGYFSRFRDVLLADFDDDQVANFVRNWFRSDQDRQHGIAEEFLKILGEPANASAKELASTPLLLTFLCLTYDDRQRLPPNRSELYRQALEILMERWAASKRVHNEPVYQELHSRLEVQMLAEIAAPAFRDNRYFFTRRELLDNITTFLRNELNAPSHLDSSQVLNAIEIQQGLIVQRAQDAWSFSHLTLQEYLTAVWYEDTKQTKNLIKHLFDVRWREVFILLAGSISKTDDLLKQMQRAAEKQLTSAPQCVRLLHWANNRISPLENEKQTMAARRAFAIAIALTIKFALNRVHARPRVRSTARVYARSLARSLDFHLSRVLHHVRELNRIHDHELDHIFDPNLVLELVVIRDQNLDTFELYINSLLSLLSEIDSSHLLPGEWDKTVRQLRSERNQLGRDASIEDLIKAWQRSLNILANAVQLPPELRNLDEGDSLESYLYACQLIVDCKNAATRVSRSVWDDICQRMLKPPEQQPTQGVQGDIIKRRDMRNRR